MIGMMAVAQIAAEEAATGAAVPSAASDGPFCASAHAIVGCGGMDVALIGVSAGIDPAALGTPVAPQAISKNIITFSASTWYLIIFLLCYI
jgi:hypothetical protein